MMDVRSILLGFLLHKPMSGYELKKAFTISFSFFSGLSYGSIYPSLKKMEKEGLVTVQVEARERTANRKVYTVTPRGREAFLHTLGSPSELERQRSTFLMQLFFFAHLSKEGRLNKIRRYLASIGRIQEGLQASRPEIERHADSFQRLCLRFGQRFYRDLAANISDIAAALEELEGGQEDDPARIDAGGTGSRREAGE
jgi:DNA-binding PadR family transcriptional regulator